MTAVLCEVCQVPVVRGKCPECGRAARGQEDAPRKNRVGNDNPVVPHRCAFRTGDWQCRWGKYAPRRMEFVLCPVHDEGLRRGITGTAEMFALLLELREEYQGGYAMTQFLDLDGIKAFKYGRLTPADRPFWWKPLEVCWAAISGLPLPANAQVCEGQASLAVKDEAAEGMAAAVIGGLAGRAQT